MKKYLLILVIGSLLMSCGGSYMTDLIISQNGTKIFDANFSDTWNAAKGVLETQGYAIAFENKEKGVLNTKQKLIKAVSNTSYEASGIFRQYLVKITPISEKQTKVVLTPRIFNGNNDISAGKIWAMEGPNGEIALWKKFFKDMQNLL